MEQLRLPQALPADRDGLSAPTFETCTFQGRRFTVCAVDPTRLELFWRDRNDRPYRTFRRLERALAREGRRLIFAMNAGMYEPDRSPVGLYVADGREQRPLNRRSGSGNFYLKPNGVFAVTGSGARIVTTARYGAIRETVRLATQSGPLLVVDGELHPAFRANAPSLRIRNGVGVASPRKVFFVLSEEPVRFYELATLFRDRLGCPDALYLDGSISGLFSSTMGRCDRRSDLGPMLAVATAASSG